MSNTAFQARGNLSRTLTYRPHLRASYYGLLAFSAVSALVVVGMALIAFINGTPDLALMVGLGGSLAPIVLFIEAHFFVHPLAFVKIKVHQHGITMEEQVKVTEISFNDVESIKFSHVPYVGGWFKLMMKNGQIHRFTVVLERSEYILEMLAAAKPGIVNAEEMLKYRRTAVLADHSWGRVTDKMKNHKGLLLKYLVTPALLAAVWIGAMTLQVQQDAPGVWGMMELFLIIAIVNLAVGFLITFSFGEFLIVTRGREKILADPAALQRDYAFEKKVERFSLLGHWLLALGLLAFAFLRYQF